MAEQSRDRDPRDRVAMVTAVVATVVGLFVAQFGGPAVLENVPLLAAGVAGGYRLGYDEKRTQAKAWAGLAMVAAFGLLYFAVHVLGDPMSEAAPWPLADVRSLQVSEGSCVKVDVTIGSSEGVDLARRLAEAAAQRQNGRSRTAWWWQVDRWTDQVDAAEPDPAGCDAAKNLRLAAAGLAVGALVLLGMGEAAIDAVRGGIGKR